MVYKYTYTYFRIKESLFTFYLFFSFFVGNIFSIYSHDVSKHKQQTEGNILYLYANLHIIIWFRLMRKKWQLKGNLKGVYKTSGINNVG